jgi:hypothetical protein
VVLEARREHEEQLHRGEAVGALFPGLPRV